MRTRTPIPRDQRPPLPEFTPVPRKCRHDGWTSGDQRVHRDARGPARLAFAHLLGKCRPVLAARKAAEMLGLRVLERGRHGVAFVARFARRVNANFTLVT